MAFKDTLQKMFKSVKKSTFKESFHLRLHFCRTIRHAGITKFYIEVSVMVTFDVNAEIEIKYAYLDRHFYEIPTCTRTNMANTFDVILFDLLEERTFSQYLYYVLTDL